MMAGGACTRRAFLTHAAAAAPLLLATPALLRAQPSTTVNMAGDFYMPVRPAPKPGAVASLDGEAINTLERTLACPCPCTLDVYTCRTTDVTCTNSPAIHRDVVRMVDGGYSGDEIVAELTNVYGQRILMAPRKSGFNLVAWFLPFVAIGTGAVAIAVLLRTWRNNARAAATLMADGTVRPIRAQGTDEEMARLNAALRDDSR
jgi:cytochrome c-type biogenesis protein CcmH